MVIRAVPVSYAYCFGDGDSTTTASPGSPHPDLEITHAYARTGDVVVRVDTTYAGEYRIGQGEWTSIPDTLTVEGAGRTSRSSRRSRSSCSSRDSADNVEDPSHQVTRIFRDQRAARFPPTGARGSVVRGRGLGDPQRPHQPGDQQQPDEEAGDRAEAGQRHEAPGRPAGAAARRRTEVDGGVDEVAPGDHAEGDRERRGRGRPCSGSAAPEPLSATLLAYPPWTRKSLWRTRPDRAPRSGELEPRHAADRGSRSRPTGALTCGFTEGSKLIRRGWAFACHALWSGRTVTTTSSSYTAVVIHIWCTGQRAYRTATG